MKHIDIKNFLRLPKGKIQAYEVPVFEPRVKLDANESPYQVNSDTLLRIIQDTRPSINRYPDPGYLHLRQIMAKKWGCLPDQILIGNGSDELIQAIIIAFGGKDKRVFVPSPSFVMYRLIAESLGEMVQEIPLNDNFELEISEAWREQMYDASKAGTSGNLIFLAIPNNPTGNCFSAAAVKEILEHFHGLVCIDEAYFDFINLPKNNYLDLLADHPNLIILRTLSKIGLAGLRLGFLIADEPVVQYIRRVKLPYNINLFSELLARYILTENGGGERLEARVNEIKGTRDWLYEQMKLLTGIRVYPSEANFILFKVNKEPARVYEKLLEHGILIRNFGNQGRLQGHFRVTIGTREESGYFLEKLTQSLRITEEP